MFLTRKASQQHRADGADPGNVRGEEASNQPPGGTGHCFGPYRGGTNPKYAL